VLDDAEGELVARFGCGDLKGASDVFCAEAVVAREAEGLRWAWERGSHFDGVVCGCDSVFTDLMLKRSNQGGQVEWSYVGCVRSEFSGRLAGNQIRLTQKRGRK